MEARREGTGCTGTGEQWQALLEEYFASGKSVRVFSREKGITPWRIYNHLRRARKTDAGQGFVEIVGGAPGSIWIEAGKCRIQVQRGFDAELLRQVAEALT